MDVVGVDEADATVVERDPSLGVAGEVGHPLDAPVLVVALAQRVGRADPVLEHLPCTSEWPVGLPDLLPIGSPRLGVIRAVVRLRVELVAMVDERRDRCDHLGAVGHVGGAVRKSIGDGEVGLFHDVGVDGDDRVLDGVAHVDEPAAVRRLGDIERNIGERYVVNGPGEHRVVREAPVVGDGHSDGVHARRRVAELSLDLARHLVHPQPRGQPGGGVGEEVRRNVGVRPHDDQ